MEEMKKVIASVFRKVGKQSVSMNDFVFCLSFDFRWCPPDEAREFVKRGLAEGLLEADDNVFTPTFDLDGVDVPVAYRPPKEVFSKPDLFERILSRLCKKMEKKEAISRINSLQERLKILDAEVVALIIARNMNIDVEDLIDETLVKYVKG
jgi:hypothetical protein